MSKFSTYLRSSAFSSENTLKGFESYMRELNKEILLLPRQSLRGLVLAAAYIRNQTEKTPPLTPIDLGNLRASWFVVTANGVPAGRSVAKFKNNPKVKRTATQFASDHTSTIAEAQRMVQSMGSNKRKAFVMMGYSANYALFVHEMQGADFQKPGADWKWFETHMKMNHNKLLRIIGESMIISKHNRMIT